LLNGEKMSYEFFRIL